ncbi:MAG: hypothetical protein WC054_00705 [Candidatus Nanopelagicales bacterium]
MDDVEERIARVFARAADIGERTDPLKLTADNVRMRVRLSLIEEIVSDIEDLAAQLSCIPSLESAFKSEAYRSAVRLLRQALEADLSNTGVSP